MSGPSVAWPVSETANGVTRGLVKTILFIPALQVTDPGPRRKPIRIATGKLHVAAGVVIGAGSVAAAAVAPLGAVLAVPLAGAVFGGYLIVKGIRSLFRKVKHV